MLKHTNHTASLVQQMAALRSNETVRALTAALPEEKEFTGEADSSHDNRHCCRTTDCLSLSPQPSSPGRGLIDASHLVSVSAVWIVLWQQGGATLQNSSTHAAELTAPEGHEPRVLGREQGEESSLRLEL